MFERLIVIVCIIFLLIGVPDVVYAQYAEGDMEPFDAMLGFPNYVKDYCCPGYEGTPPQEYTRKIQGMNYNVFVGSTYPLEAPFVTLSNVFFANNFGLPVTRFAYRFDIVPEMNGEGSGCPLPMTRWRHIGYPYQGGEIIATSWIFLFEICY